MAYKSKVFLFTGDIERTAEEILVNLGENVKANVVKVPHHGSRTSSSQPFVDAVDADFSVISVGKRSMFGHPHKEVVERWLQNGSKLMTTGESGTITFVTDGDGIFVDTFVK
jgi:competence protein ComEC